MERKVNLTNVKLLSTLKKDWISKEEEYYHQT